MIRLLLTLLIANCTLLSYSQNMPSSVIMNDATIASVAVSHDGKNVALMPIFENITIWDIENQNKVLELKPTSEFTRNTCISYSKNKNYLIAGGLHSTALLWDAKTGRLLHLFRT